MNTLLLCALLVAAGAPALAQNETESRATEKDRVTPQPAASPAFNLPAAALRQAINGVKLAVIENHRLPLVAVTLVIPRAGSVADPSGKEGLAGFVAALMKEGTVSHPSAVAFSDAQDDIGATISVSAGSDAMTVSLVVLKEHLDKGMALMSELVREPLFLKQSPAAARSLERLRQESLTGLKMAKGDPEGLASERLASRIYPDHPYGRVTTEASVVAITLQDAVSRFNRGVVPTGSVMAAAGDLTADELKALADKHFASWSGLLTIMPVNPPPPTTKGKPVAQTAGPFKIDLIDLPGEQSQIQMGHVLIPRNHPDFVKVAVMNGILGGPVIGRIEANIREAKSWAYGARSAVNAAKDAGSWTCETSVQKDKTGAAVSEILGEIRRMQTTPVPAEELAAAKKLMTGLYLQRTRTVQSLAGRLATNELMGLPASEIADYVKKLDAVTVQDIQAMAVKYLRPDAIHIVVVGTAAEVYAQLTPIAPVRVLNTNGQEIQPPAPAAAGI